LAPLIENQDVRLTASHEHLDGLLADLALHRLEVVIADRPVPSGSAIKAYNHVLGTTPMGLFAAPSLANRVRPGFPSSLEGAPLLVPGRDSVVYEQLRQWLESHRLAVRIVGEFDDGGLMKTFGASGIGAFPAPLTLRSEIERLYGVELVGVLEGVTERYYAISTERRATDPQVVRLLALADELLSEAPAPVPTCRTAKAGPRKTSRKAR
jgi:LysR family transcriptional activator of nhaA